MDPCYLETKKCSLQHFGARKKRMTAILNQKKRFAAIWREKSGYLLYTGPASFKGRRSRTRGRSQCVLVKIWHRHYRLEEEEEEEEENKKYQIGYFTSHGAYINCTIIAMLYTLWIGKQL